MLAAHHHQDTSTAGWRPPVAAPSHHIDDSRRPTTSNKQPATSKQGITSGLINPCPRPQRNTSKMHAPYTCIAKRIPSSTILQLFAAALTSTRATPFCCLFVCWCWCWCCTAHASQGFTPDEAPHRVETLEARESGCLLALRPVEHGSLLVAPGLGQALVPLLLWVCLKSWMDKAASEHPAAAAVSTRQTAGTN